MSSSIIIGGSSPSALERALHYQRLEFSVVPIPKGASFPIRGWQVFQRERATEAQIRDWFGGNSTHEVAVIAGPVSQIAVVRVVDWVVPWFRKAFGPALAEVRGRGVVEFYYRSWVEFQHELDPNRGTAISVIYGRSWAYPSGSKDPAGFQYAAIRDFPRDLRMSPQFFDRAWLKEFQVENVEFKRMLAQSRRQSG